MSGFDQEVYEVFREEAAERLDRMVEMLLALESGKAPADAVDSLFRDAHSIKGSAGMVGLEPAREIAHRIEDQLQGPRDEGVFPAELTEPLLRATDQLRLAVAGEDTAAHAQPAAPAERAEPAKPAPTAKPSEPGQPPERHSMRVPAEKVDRLLDAVGETVLQSRRLEHALGNGAASNGDGEARKTELDRAGLLLDELQDSVIQMRTLPLSSITAPLPRAVRDLAAAHDRQVELEISGGDTPLDRVILDGLSDPINHLLRNAVAHGIESPAERERAGKPPCGRIELRAEQRGGLVAIEVVDDGRGVAPELVARASAGRTLAGVLAEGGVSTAEAVSDVSGRGVGLDAVHHHVESLRGTLEVRSEPGRSTTVTMLLPLTLALLRVLLVERGGQAFGLPLTSVEEVVTVGSTMSLGGRESIELRGRPVPLADLAQILGMEPEALPATPPAVVVTSSGRPVAAACERIVEELEVVVKSLGPLLAGVAGYLGAAIMDDGRVALILDPAFLAKALTGRAADRRTAENGDRPPSKVLVVDDQFTVRELQRTILETAGYRVETAHDGRDALRKVSGESCIDLVVTDIDMPEMDGLDLLRSIRADPQHFSLPVVVVSGRAGEEDRELGVEAGADAYIVKEDFDQRDLLDTVDRLLMR